MVILILSAIVSKGGRSPIKSQVVGNQSSSLVVYLRRFPIASHLVIVH